MGKKALVLCGGGAKGAYQIGAWKALKKLGFKPDIITGTSVGALNGCLMIMGDYEKAYNVWTHIGMNNIFSFDDVDISKSKSMMDLTTILLKSGKSASYEPLLKLIDSCIDEDKIRNSKIDFGFVTTQFLPLKKVEIFKNDIPKGQLKDYVMASAACYPYMKSFSIGDKKFIDGGYFDNMPIDMAIKKGATDIVVLDLKAIGVNTKLTNMDANITYIGTRHNLGGIMMFDMDNSLRNIELGYLDTMKTFNVYEGDLYTFRKGSNLKASKFENKVLANYKKIYSHLPVTNIFETTGKTALEEYLKKYNQELFTINSNVLTCFEFALNIFEFDYLELYKFRKTRKRLLEKFNYYYKNKNYNEISELSKNFKKLLKPDGIKKFKNTYNKKNIVCYIYDKLNTEVIPTDDKKEIWIYSMLFPDAVLAAIIICSLK